MWKELLAASALGIGSVMGASCGANDENNAKYQNIVEPQTADTTSVDELRGNNFIISRLGKNIFKVSGSEKDAAIRYLSENCDVLSVGAWNTDNTWNSRIIEHIVTVADATCLPQLD